MFVFLYFLATHLLLFPSTANCPSSFAAIKAITDGYEAYDFGDICAAGKDNAEDRRVGLLEARNNLKLGLTVLPLASIDMHQNYFWCAEGGDNDFPGDDVCGGLSTQDNGKLTFSSRTWGSWWRADYAWKRESVERLASLIYLMTHEIDFYSGMIAGRLYCARLLKDRHRLAQQLPLKLLGAAETSSFQKGRHEANRFYTTLLGGDTRCMSAKLKTGAVYLANNNGKVSYITPLNTGPLTASPVEISESSSSSLQQSIVDWFTTRIIVNHEMLHGKYRGGGTSQHTPGGSALFYDALTHQAESSGHGGDGYNYFFRILLYRLQEMLKLGHNDDPHRAENNASIENSLIVFPAALVSDQVNNNNVIPIATEDPDQTFIITPFANVALLGADGNLRTHADGKGLLHLRAACLDLAATKDYVALLGLGRRSPPLGANGRTVAPFDPYSGDNYFAYLRVVPNSNVLASGSYLSAEVGQEGEDDSNCDRYVYFTDLDLKGEPKFKSNYMKFVDFDKNGNLFILTDTGYILYYNARQLRDKQKGKITPRLLDASGLPGQNNAEQNGGVDFMSCGDGIVVRAMEGGQPALYYLRDTEVNGSTAGLMWHKCIVSKAPNNFTYTNDGALLIYDGTDISLFGKENFMITVSSIISASSDLSVSSGISTMSKRKQLAILCHEVLGTSAADGTYFTPPETCPKTGTYLFITSPQVDASLPVDPTKPVIPSLSDAKAWLDAFKTLYASLPKLKDDTTTKEDFWNEDMAYKVQEAIDALRAKFTLTPEQETSNVGVAVASFLSDLHSFETDVLAKNSYFQIRTFQQIIKNLERLRVLADSDGLKTEVKSVMENASFALGKTAFSDIDDVLTSASDKDINASGSSHTVAKSSIVRQWVLGNRDSLVTLGVAEQDVDNWAKSLLDSEVIIYTTDDNDAVRPEKILSDIKNYLALISINAPNSLAAKSDLIVAEKQQIVDAFVDIANVCKNYMSDEDLQKVQDGFVFLDNKFQLSGDADFVKMLSAKNVSGRFSAVLTESLKLVYNTARVVSLFKACAQSVVSADKIDALLAVAESLVNDKALFEVKATPATPNDNDATIGGGTRKDKDAFVNYLSDLLIKNTILKSYEESITNPRTDEKSLVYWSIQLQAPADVADYSKLFLELSARKDAENNQNIAKNLYDKMVSASVKSQLSPQNITMINAAVGAFRNKGITTMEKINTSDTALTANFKAFLTLHKNGIQSNLDSTTKFFSSSDKAVLVAECKALARYQEFAPSFNSEFQKKRFASMLYCLNCSLDAAIQGSLDSEDQHPALVQARADVTALITQIANLE